MSRRKPRRADDAREAIRRWLDIESRASVMFSEPTPTLTDRQRRTLAMQIRYAMERRERRKT